MAAVFDKLGIRFQYPENWMLDESDALAGEQSVTLTSPQGGFWMVAVHPARQKSGELLRIALKAMQTEYEEVEMSEAEEQVAGHALTGYDLQFFCLDLTNTALIRVAKTADKTLLILSQAEDRDLPLLEKVFLAITTSLLSSQKPADS